MLILYAEQDSFWRKSLYHTSHIWLICIQVASLLHELKRYVSSMTVLIKIVCYIFDNWMTSFQYSFLVHFNRPNYLVSYFVYAVISGCQIQPHCQIVKNISCNTLPSVKPCSSRWKCLGLLWVKIKKFHYTLIGNWVKFKCWWRLEAINIF